VPELPDVEAYREAVAARTAGRILERVRLSSPFVLRSVEPPVAEAEGRRVRVVRRLGKRIVLGLEGDLFLAMHLMIAGRLHWRAREARPPGRAGLAALDFPEGTLVLTEAGTRRRASIHLVRGETGLRALDRGGIEPLEAGPDAFRAAVLRGNHTLKRALTDPANLAGIGNAYSDEILHRARLSPVQLASRLDGREMARLHAATRAVLSEWVARLRAEAAGGFPGRVTAFREGMAVHGRYRQPCPDCGTPVQRIVRGEGEANYCPRCQTGGRVLSDRSLARLLRSDWPRTIDELERHPALGRIRLGAQPRQGAPR
jgi:formamidopyrimidine-DNA glycosylase